MNHREAGRYWDRNAAAWTQLARQGYDVYRDVVNTPAFLDLLPDVAGKHGLDVGCGDGHNTRLIASRAASMTGVDVSPKFVALASAVESGICYVAGSAVELPFAAARFDFVTAIMSLMDLPEQELAFSEMFRVLRPGGFLQFSILHPCFNPPHRRLRRTFRPRKPYAVELGQYFERVDGMVSRWLFSAAPPAAKAGLPPFEIPIFHRTLAEWINAVIGAGFVIERMAEPRADEETARRVPAVADTRVVAYFLHLLCRKP